MTKLSKKDLKEILEEVKQDRSELEEALISCRDLSDEWHHKTQELNNKITEKDPDKKTLLKGSGASGSGAGAGDGSGGGGTGDTNPWASDSFNLTEQGRILREDPALAKRLAGEAGRTLPETI